jgi:hypothetical protein
MNYTTASASITGSSHQKLYYNNQDAYHFYQDDHLIVGVVADGCGGGSDSEVGARLGVNFVVNFCRKHFTHAPFEVNILKNGLVDFLKQVVKNQQTSEELEFIENYLFFTLFGFIVQKDQTTIFHSGDGVYLLNDKEVVIDQLNRPNYIAKTLISGAAEIGTESIATAQLDRLLVATDGLLHLKQPFAQQENLGGITQISDFFDNSDFFEDIIALPKYLTELATKRILRDDTTMILLK